MSTYIILNNKVKSALRTGNKTTVVEVGNLSSTVAKKTYDNGKGSTYNFYENIVNSFTVPGMKKTTVGNKTCDDMTPQGLAYHDGYFFISAYCHSGKHNSVIYVLDADSKEYVTTLILADHTHAGGVAYANGYLWVTDTSDSGEGILAYYNYAQISQGLAAVKESFADDDVEDYTAVMLGDLDHGTVRLGAGNKASFITEYGGYLCVGEFVADKDGKGEFNFYDPVELLKGKVNKTTVATLPKKSQGACFYSIDSTTYLIVTTSYGRNNPSYVHIYKASLSAGKLNMSKVKSMEMPSMIEGVTTYKGITYFVFESCAKGYRNGILCFNKAKEQVGRVCGFGNEFVCK